MEEETWNPLEVRDLMTRVASGVDPEETTPWEQVAPRQIDGADLLRFEGYVTEIFTAFGLQLDTPGTRRTPTRFLKALYDATAGYEGDHKLMTVFRAEHRCDPDHLVGQVIEGPIPFYSVTPRSWSSCRGATGSTLAQSSTSCARADTSAS
jgi:hypothetical protein